MQCRVELQSFLRRRNPVLHTLRTRAWYASLSGVQLQEGEPPFWPHLQNPPRSIGTSLDRCLGASIPFTIRMTNRVAANYAPRARSINFYILLFDWEWTLGIARSGTIMHESTALT